jgi:hypothetical protein
MSKDFREFYGRDSETGRAFMYKVDADTDELISKTPVVDRKDTSNNFEKGEFSMSSRSFDMFLEEKYHEYNKLDFVVISWLRKNITDDNYIKYFRQAELAKVFKTKQPNISESLKKIEKDGIIYKDKEKGLYVFNPKYIRYIFGEETVESIARKFEETEE